MGREAHTFHELEVEEADPFGLKGWMCWGFSLQRGSSIFRLPFNFTDGIRRDFGWWKYYVLFLPSVNCTNL